MAAGKPKEIILATKENPKVSLEFLLQRPPLPLPLRLKVNHQWWLLHATPQVYHWVTEGISAPWPYPLGQHCNQWPVLSRKINYSAHQEPLALSLIKEYIQLGAMIELRKPPTWSWPETLAFHQIFHLVPWFVIQKMEGSKIKNRLITDCREINQFLFSPHFKMDHWGQFCPS